MFDISTTFYDVSVRRFFSVLKVFTQLAEVHQGSVSFIKVQYRHNIPALERILRIDECSVMVVLTDISKNVTI